MPCLRHCPVPSRKSFHLDGTSLLVRMVHSVFLFCLTDLVVSDKEANPLSRRSWIIVRLGPAVALRRPQGAFGNAGGLSAQSLDGDLDGLPGIP